MRLLQLLSLFACNKDAEISKATADNENYLNYTGEEHNKLVDYVRNNSNKNTLSYSEIYDLVIESLDLSGQAPISKEECISLLNQYENFNYETKIDELLSDGMITIKQKNTIDEAYQIIKSGGEYQTKQSDLSLVEQNLLSDEVMSTNEKEKMLVFISISKNSLEYWDSEYNNQKAPWWAIVLADAIGGGVGFGTGGPWGGVILGAMASIGMSQQNL